MIENVIIYLIDYIIEIFVYWILYTVYDPYDLDPVYGMWYTSIIIWILAPISSCQEGPRGAI